MQTKIFQVGDQFYCVTFCDRPHVSLWRLTCRYSHGGTGGLIGTKPKLCSFATLLGTPQFCVI